MIGGPGMPKLDMDGPFDLKDGVIEQEVDKDMIGNFALGFMSKDGKFVVKAIGRSDKDLNKEITSTKRRIFRRTPRTDVREEQAGQVQILTRRQCGFSLSG